MTGAYVPCSSRRSGLKELEGGKHLRTEMCIQCDNTPPFNAQETTNVTFSISLDGSFEDVKETLEFWYYRNVKLSAIKPTHGPKDGGTTVQVWGEHFYEFSGKNDNEQAFTSCSFGVKSVPAKIQNEGYLICVSPDSDVVNRPMPFGVSLNGQQSSKDKMDFWYYNDPQVTTIYPDTGAEKGGNVLTLHGEGFKPFLTS